MGTARLISLSITNAVHKVGFSWRSLNHALGGIAKPEEWAVLYLGTQKDSVSKTSDSPFQVLDRKGKPLPPKSIKGIVLLDGNWKQSKTLWWRNPWLLKLNRIVLNPETPSQYGSIRKEPRKNCLSTIEAAAETFSALGEDSTVPLRLKKTFCEHLSRIQSVNAPSAQ